MLARTTEAKMALSTALMLVRCWRDGTSLARIDTAVQNTKANDICGSTSCWIGYHDENVEDVWTGLTAAIIITQLLQVDKHKHFFTFYFFLTFVLY